jgi:hypothetical protein
MRACRFSCFSELNDRQTRNPPEVARIDRQHGIAERKRSCTDQEIGEWNHDSAALLLRIQSAREPCNVRRQWIDGDSGKKFIDEGFPARPTFGGIRTVDPMDELDDADRR